MIKLQVIFTPNCIENADESLDYTEEEIQFKNQYYLTELLVDKII